MERTQINQIAGNKSNQSSTTLLGILLHRLELTGLFKSFVVRTSLGRCSSMVRSISLLSLLFIATISFSTLGSSNVYADYTISMTSSGAQSIDVMPGSNAGSGNNGTAISTDSITVNTNCRAGYNLNIATSVNDNNLYLGGDSSNNTAGTYFTPADGTTALGSSVNKWGYYYNSSAPTTSPTKNNVFTAVPASSSPASIITPTTSATDISDSFNIYYGVSIGSGLTPGTYKMIPDTNSSNGSGGYNNGSIVYYLTVAEACISYTVNFNPTSTAGGNTLSGTGTMNPQTIPAGVATALNTNTFTAPTGYGFDSWNTAQDGTGTSYTDGQSVTDLTTGGGNITLYAQWKKIMQDLRFSDCRVNVGVGGNATDIGDNIAVVDKRDNKKYTVRYINGECWMTQNLRYLGDTGSAAGTMTIGNSNSNVSNKDITLYSLKDGDAQSFNAYSSSTCGSGNTAGYTHACVYDSGSTSTGVWYNYYAASAGTISGSSNSTTATSDICPAGWHLPSGPTTTSNTDFNKLVGTTGSEWQNTTAGFTAFSAVAGGDYYNGSLRSTGNGSWWSATASSTTYRYNMMYDSGNGMFSGGYGNSRYDGRFVRCVKDSDGYMQDQTASSLATLMPNEGDTTTLKDKRDGKPYTVGKLADGNYWMLENLALDITAVSLDTLKGNTNADDASLTYLKNGGGSSPYATAGVSKAWTSSSRNYYNRPMIAVDSTTSGPCRDAYCVNSNKSWSSTSVTSATINGVTSIAQGKIGVYYNYCAASAGYYCYAGGAGVDNPEGTTTLQDSKYDICPSGWRLPASTSNGEFQALYTTYNSNYTDFQAFLSTPLSGSFDSGLAIGQGDFGRFWSSTWNGTSSMYSLYINSSNVVPSYYYDRFHGLSVRCILAE